MAVNLEAELKQRDRRIEALEAEVQRLREATVYLYNSGYMAGHNDTVEACFTDIYECDMDTYHDDVVAELLTDKALEETK